MQILRQSIARPAVVTAVLGAVMTMGALTAQAQSVNTDYDHNADFSHYKTFSFGKVQTANPLYEQRVRDEITKELTGKGLTQAPSGGDLSVTAIGNTKDQQEYNTFYDGLGGGGFGWRGWRGWGGGCLGRRGWRGWGGGWGGDATTTVSQIPVGTLVVDLYDMSSHNLVWRGRAEKDISNNAEKNTKGVDKAIDKMFAKYPPKAK